MKNRVASTKLKFAKSSMLRSCFIYGFFLFLLNCGAKQETYCINTSKTNCNVISKTGLVNNPTPNTDTDATPPTFSGDLFFSEINASEIKINWEKASDQITSQSNLEYRVIYTDGHTVITTDNSKAELASGILLQTDWSKNLTTAKLTGLDAETSYMVAVLVRDEKSNISILGPKQISTSSQNAPTTGAVITFSAIKDTSLTLSWGLASDEVTNTANLKYKVVKSTDLTSVSSVSRANALTDSDIVIDWVVATKRATALNLSPNTQYYFAVLVKNDEEHNSLYRPAAVTTLVSFAPNVAAAISFKEVKDTSLKISWIEATGGHLAETLRYKIVKGSLAAAIDTISEIEAVTGNDLVQDYAPLSPVAEKLVTGLEGDTSYVFAILVKDTLDKVAIYSPASVTTLLANQVASNDTPTPTPVSSASASPTPDGSPDTTQPFVILSTTSSNPSSTSPLNFSVTFSETISGFEQADIAITNGAASAPSGSGTTYTFIVVPTAQGAVTVSLPAGKVQDTAGNTNTASNIINITYDSTAPTISVTGPATNSYINAVNNNTTFAISGTCSEVSQIVTIKIDTVALGSGGSCTGTTFFASINATTLSGGSHSLTATITDTAGNSVTSASINITKDADSPGAPTSLSDGIANNSASGSPTITFIAQGDIGVSGVFKHQARVVANDGTTQISAWADFTSGSTITGLTLSTNTSYKVQIKAIDNAGNESSVGTSDGWLVDVTNPTDPSGITLNAYATSTTGSPTVTFTNGTDIGGSGIATHMVRVMSADLVTEKKTWQSFVSGTTISGLALADHTTYKVQIKAIDNAGNESSIVTSSGWTTDITPPVAASALIDGNYLSSLTASPTVTFTDGTDIGGSLVLKHQIRVVSSDETTEYKAWTDFVSGGSVSGLSLVNNAFYKVQIKAIDNAGNESSVTTGDGWFADITPPVAISTLLDGTYNSSLTATPSITFTSGTDISGSGILKHQARVVANDGTTQVSAWADFISGNTISGLSLSTNTTYKIQVKAIDNALNEASIVTSDGFIADTTLPAAVSALLDGSYNSSLTATPTITFASGTDISGSGILKHQARVVASDGTTQISGWADFVSGNTISGLSLTTNTSYKIQVKAIDNSLNESSIVTSDGWFADTTLPVAASALLDGTYSTSLTATPTITFVSGTDISGSGILKHQARVVANDGTTQVSAWADFTSGSTISGLSLTTNTTYKIQVKAIDNALNESVVTTSDGWFADGTLPVAASSLLDGTYNSSLSTTPSITFTSGTDISGSGLLKHQARVVANDGVTQVSAWADFTSGNTISGLSLTTNTTYKIQVKVIDNALNESSVVTGDGWIADLSQATQFLA